MPQVGYREASGSTGLDVQAEGISVARFARFLNLDYQNDTSGKLISRDIQPGLGMDSKLNGFMQFRFIDDAIRTPAGEVIGRKQFAYVAQFSPSRVFLSLESDGTLGQDIDFDNSRPGRGTTINASATVRPTHHLELALVENQQWLNVNPLGEYQRLFVSRVSRVKGTYNFTSRLFARVIAQYVSTDADPSLYLNPVPARSGNFSGSVLLVVQDQLAVRDVHRLRRRPRADGCDGPGLRRPAPGADRPSGVREALVRVSAVARHAECGISGR